MKKYARIAILLAITVLPCCASFAAGCLSAYNSRLNVCDTYYCPNGIATCGGCYADALAGYYACLVRQATT